MGWKGLFFDRLMTNALGSQLTPGGVGLYRARNRSYSPTLGRWLQRDPNATAQPILEAALFNGLAFSDFALRMDAPTLYGDGMNLFQFGWSNPIAYDDPLGLDLGLTYPGQLTVVRTWADIATATAPLSTLGMSLVVTLLLTDALVPDQQVQTLEILEQVDREWGIGGAQVENATKEQIAEAKREYYRNRQFRNWFHKVYCPSQKMSGTKKHNADLPWDQVWDALVEWRVLGKPKV